MVGMGKGVSVGRRVPAGRGEGVIEGTAVAGSGVYVGGKLFRLSFST
jgi:hypothetical protein